MWIGVPFMAVIFVAGLLGVSKDLLEAAEVDGASRWAVFWNVEFPSIQPIVLIAVLLRTMDAFRNFEGVKALTGGGPGLSSQVANLEIYQNAFVYNQMGLASALVGGDDRHDHGRADDHVLSPSAGLMSAGPLPARSAARAVDQACAATHRHRHRGVRARRRLPAVRWVLLTAFKPPIDARAIPPKFLPPYTLDNFAALFQRPIPGYRGDLGDPHGGRDGTDDGDRDAGRVRVSRGRFDDAAAARGLAPVHAALAEGHVHPADVPVLPPLGLIDTYLGLALAYMSGLLPFAIWLMSGYFADIPIELEEAARIDRLQPVAGIPSRRCAARPAWGRDGRSSSPSGRGTSTSAALILGGPHTTPATVGITTYVGQFSLDYGQLAAGSMFLLVPIIVLTVVAQRGLLRGSRQAPSRADGQGLATPAGGCRPDRTPSPTEGSDDRRSV